MSYLTDIIYQITNKETLAKENNRTYTYQTLFYLLGEAFNTLINQYSNDIKTITANTTTALVIGTYKVDTSLGNITVTLLTTGVVKGKTWTINKVAAANTLTIVAESGTVQYKTSATVTVKETSLTFQFDGTNFIII